MSKTTADRNHQSQTQLWSPFKINVEHTFNKPAFSGTSLDDKLNPLNNLSTFVGYDRCSALHTHTHGNENAIVKEYPSFVRLGDGLIDDWATTLQNHGSLPMKLNRVTFPNRGSNHEKVSVFPYLNLFIFGEQQLEERYTRKKSARNINLSSPKFQCVDVYCALFTNSNQPVKQRISCSNKVNLSNVV